MVHPVYHKQLLDMVGKNPNENAENELLYKQSAIP